MKLSEFDLMRICTAYVEDGYLKKWRFHSNNANDIDNQLNQAMIEELFLTDSEISYIKSFDNVIVIENGIVEFINFNGFVKKY